MTVPPSIWTTTPKVPDMDAIAETWRRIFHGGVDAMFAGAERSRTARWALPYDPSAPARAFADLTVGLMSDPMA